MKITRFSSVAALGALAALTLAGCAANEAPADNGDNGGDAVEESTLSGTLSGIGASSMGSAQDAWAVGFQSLHSGVTVNYAAEGSGAGRGAFIGGGADFAGSDRAFHVEEIEESTFEQCASDSIVEIPVYISPVALAFNLPGIESINMDAETIALAFRGDITTWDDERIASQNPDVDLPSTALTPVVRADTSGTTETFVNYLQAVVPEVWDFEISGDFPSTGDPVRVQQTSGVAEAIAGGEGTLGYLDASRVPDEAGQIHVEVGGEYTAFSAEAASALVEGSALQDGREPQDLVFDVDPASAQAGSYPIALVAYAIACAEYTDSAQAELVKAYFEYMVSEEAQLAAQEHAGSAPLSESLRQTILDEAVSVIS